MSPSFTLTHIFYSRMIDIILFGYANECHSLSSLVSNFSYLLWVNFRVVLLNSPCSIFNTGQVTQVGEIIIRPITVLVIYKQLLSILDRSRANKSFCNYFMDAFRNHSTRFIEVYKFISTPINSCFENPTSVPPTGGGIKGLDSTKVTNYKMWKPLNREPYFAWEAIARFFRIFGYVHNIPCLCYENRSPSVFPHDGLCYEYTKLSRYNKADFGSKTEYKKTVL